MKPIYIAFGLLGAFFAIERRLRQGASARDLQESASDHGSTRALAMAFVASAVSMDSALILNRRKVGTFRQPALAWAGIALMLTGLGIRIWAIRVLGAHYTRTLKTGPEQRIVAEGPYRVVRHPGYLGTLLVWLGAGIATANWISTATIAVLMAPTYRYRIAREESMLLKEFRAEYPGYMKRTWRLIPFLY